jgi:hypothetical protein
VADVVRVTVLSEEMSDGGAPMRWMEFMMVASPVAFKVQVPASGIDGQTPTRALLRLGTDVYELPPAMKKEMTGRRCAAASGVCWKNDAALPHENIKTLVGTFDTVRSDRVGPKGEPIHTWFSTKVPVLGLVKIQLPDGSGFLLTGMGHDGKSAFPKETVVRPYPFGPGGPFERAVNAAMGVIQEARDGGGGQSPADGGATP